MSNDKLTPSLHEPHFVPSGPPQPLMAGEAFVAAPDTWYNLLVTYKDRRGNKTEGLMYPLGSNPSTSFYEYMVLGSSPDGLPPMKVKLHPPDANGWSTWEMHDGNYLSLKATGWLYRSSHYPIGFRIVDGRLYNAYWGGPAGSTWRDAFVPSACYTGQGLDEFTCKLIPAP
jgi:hypothetical protein